jgi:hypothetical protein
VGSWSTTYTSTTATFDGALGTFSHGASASFTAYNTGNVYPNPAADSSYSVGVQYSGFQSASANQNFTIKVPIGDVVLPAISRLRDVARPTFYWTNSDANQTHTGVMLVRGSDIPVDKQTYVAGDTLGSSIVLCVASGTATSCAEPESVTQSDSSVVYGFYNLDADRGYSNGIRISTPARPTSRRAFVYKHQVLGLTPPGIKNYGGQGGFAVFGANDKGLYFINWDGSEARRALQTQNAVTRRSIPITDATQGWISITADSGSPDPGQMYVAVPSASPTSALTNVPVSAGVVGILQGTSSVLHSTYVDAFFVASNAASGNIVRAFARDLSAYWTYDAGTNAVTAEPAPDFQRALMFVPVSAGGGGILGFDLSVAPAGDGAPKPSGWSSKTILSGTVFKAQCRVPRMESSPGAANGWPADQALLFCGSDAGLIYAIDPATGSVVASASVTGSVQSLSPLNKESPGAIMYTTRSGRIGRVQFNGTAFSSVFETTVPMAATVSPAAVFQVGYFGIYVGAIGAIHKLDLLTGAVLDSETLDGNQISEVGRDNLTGRIYVETSAGTIWGIDPF